ncbi:hypothetical protein ACM7YN_01975 [Pseudomonas aeruginosa]|jgi:hypothetical protein|uniref:hypothetical protein n=1 Tax=Pseudomonas aeruginosa TaxID=287 RepID=UPI000F7EEF55|nr:hypothetical protein [Pseudomonas aeruginosa]MBH8714268.1 hypothetical protein [Pseudomonas aeruginosa]RTC07798.1 hypothetical protein EJ653_17375 [Pseudomonas aeruginosa]HCT7936470.1 hypothetical protein [Pseudomonas aeruginosa]HCT9925484.1 hypothetical protein [Pseudomonas aeruginosa]HEJ1890444.1 hypothetical protein [Pseudomonas aeruginosa]
MDNEVYRATVNGLSGLLGAAQPLVSGSGARFTSTRKGKATVYHANIATGNRAEVAFHCDSMTQRLGITATEFRSLVQQWKQRTGRPVQINQQHLWPRVGLSTIEQAETLIALLQEGIV